ncbi:MAG: hypothetical protein ACI8T1_003007 [Verrucomicrobiales bacterium]|jgi:hypothetical protein
MFDIRALLILAMVVLILAVGVYIHFATKKFR